MISLLRRVISAGELQVHFANGETAELSGAEEGPKAAIEVRDRSLLGKVLRGGSIALTDAYLRGDIETEDLAEFLTFAAINQQRWAEKHPRLYRIGRKIGSAFPSSEADAAVETMAGHYNMGNDFYQSWLDPTMSYSSARFSETAVSLEDAQRNKWKSLADMMDLQPGHKLLEIGTGWGGFAMYAADMGCDVTTMTIASEQSDFVLGTIAERGLSDKIDVQLQDFSNITGEFDRVVSIEMIESIDESRWAEYFDVIARVLRPGGKAGLQAIVIDNDFYETYRSNEDFIRRYIFPGGMLPSPGLLRNLTRSASLNWSTEEAFGLDYAKTLKIWHERFEASWPNIAPGFDDRFRRLWKTYLAYCEAGFRVGRIDVLQFALSR